MKIEVDMTRVGEPTQKMWEYVYSIESALNIKYDGPEEFKAVSKWIDDHKDEYEWALEFMYSDLFDLF